MNVEAGIANLLHSKKTAPHENHFFLSFLPLSKRGDLRVPFDTHSEHMSFWEDRGHIYTDLPL